MKKLLLVVLGLTLLASGCTKKEDVGGKTVVRFANWEVLPEQLELSRKIIAEFEKLNPDVKIKFEWGTTTQKILTELAANTAPDIFYWVEPTRLVEKNALEDLTPYMQKYNIDLSQHLKASIDEFTYDGKLYVFPLHFSTYCLAYNKKIFDETKEPYPNENWTWDDYYRVAKKLTSSPDQHGMRQRFGTVLPDRHVMIRLNGGRIIDENAKKCVLDSKKAREALEFSFKLLKDACPSPEEQESFLTGGKAGVSIFMTGRIAMQFAPTYMITSFAKIDPVKNFNWDVTLLPKSNDKIRRSLVYSGGFCIPAQSKNKEAAFRFVKFYCGEEGQVILAKMKNCVPSLKKVAKDVFASPPPEHIDSYLKASENAEIGSVRLGVWEEINTEVFRKEMKNVEMGKLTIDAAIKKIIPAADEILKKGGK